MEIRRLLLAIISFFLLTGLSAQSYNDLIGKANALYEAKDYQASAGVYDQAFQQEEGTARHYYNAACSWALAGEQEQALDYLEKAVEKGYIALDWMQKDSDLVSLRDTERWQTVIKDLEIRIAEYEKDMNKPLKEKLERIYMKDQALRRLIDEAQEEFGEESDEMQYFWNLMMREDSLNEKEVLAIIDKHGWPGRSEVGGKANTAVWLVIQHADLETQEKYLPLLKASVKAGESSGNHLAMLEDRILMRNGKKQIYGSQITKDPETGEWMLYPVIDPENINERRAEVGLGPIEEYLQRWNLEYDPEKAGGE